MRNNVLSTMNNRDSGLEARLMTITTLIIKELPVGKSFELKLLCGDEWDTIGEHRDKNRAGKVFKKLVDDGKISGIKFDHRNDQRHAVYIKVGLIA